MLEAVLANLISKLISVLEKEEYVYSQFLKLAEKKTDIIVNGKVRELEDITKMEQTFSTTMQKLETEREQIIGEMASSLNIQPSELTITWIIENSNRFIEKAGNQFTGKIENKPEDKPEELQQKELFKNVNNLKSIRNKIIGLVEHLKKVNDMNSNLIKNSLEYIDFSINLMTSVTNAGGKYGNDGKEGKIERKSLFDVKL